MLSNKGSQIRPSSTLAIDAKAKQMQVDGIDVVGFGAGEPDFDTPDHIKEAAIKAIEEGFTKYTPASGVLQLKEAICRKLEEDNGLHYESDQIVISNGAKHSLMNVFQAILNPGEEVIIPAPYWISYSEMVKMADGIPVIVKPHKENNLKVVLEQLEAAVTPRTKAIIINSPSNPSGMLYHREELQEIAEFAVRHNLFVVSDEIYEKLIYGDEEHVSIASLGQDIYERTIVVNGVSKSYSMTGWRIGYTASSREVAKLMGNIQSHATSNPNSIAQRAAIAALTGPQEPLKVMKEAFNERRIYMYNRIKAMPYLELLEPKGAFYVFVDVSALFGKSCRGETIRSAADLARLLLEQVQVAVVPCEDFAYETHIRLSYAISMENIRKGLDRLEAFLKEIE
ncbi:pyridoxal phosphate-dependent aminotransferase [Anaerotalea alkaliphila]|uniref:Aminotransferase n=1 Tax=Anaerotalea alkaliphila TaxID=2662126 RepID=A0A7X5HTB6_9FIRM|nr:pyridoxal phosphate-dependent aminotransferase [Anaerotalea alkaliphila]NDL66282.1 pyridoxal phosphate-dependent aminotransferase [Anaerotalea alkaliphila]